MAKVAKAAAAIENITPGEALEKLLMSIESGASRGLRTMGIFVDLNKEVERQGKLTGKTLIENEILKLRYNAVMREAADLTEQVDDLDERGPVDRFARFLGRDELVRFKQMRRGEM